MNHDIEPNSVDLIYLDPPFFTGKIQKGKEKWRPEAMEISYEDSREFWGEKPKVQVMYANAPLWMKDIADHQKEDFASYLYYMMERLKACQRVLKSTGSIYLHCDYRASSYLKMVMDNVFGYDNFRNEIIWHFTGGGRSKRYFSRKHHSLFFYTKTNKYVFNLDAMRVPYKETSGYAKNGIVNNGKKYMPNPLGTPVDDVWDIPMINPMSDERIGYPTQKPTELLRRVIEASCPKDGVVLDPFCGCGTTIMAAVEVGRRWIGIDISPFAHNEIINRKDVSFFAKALNDAPNIKREYNEVMALEPKRRNNIDGFEEWVNEFYKATKPMPDGGVDGITDKDGIPIQTKTYEIKYPQVSEFATNIKHHPKVPQPVKKGIMVSQVGFDESARKRQFEIEQTEGIKIEFHTPKDMLNLE
jgi:DNA modification methylase